MPKTYNDLYLDARRRLRQSGIEACGLEARELLCYAAGKTAEEFYRDLRLYASEETDKRFTDLLERRLRGEPTAYLIGEWQFYGLDLDITRDVLIPRTDTETVAARAIELADAAEGDCRVLDLCTGSGCIGLAVAKHVPRSRVVLADISEEVIHVAHANVRRCGLSRQVVCTRADALCAPDSLLGIFDLIVCNPPYIPSGDLANLDPSVRDYEPHVALDGGKDGLDFFRSVTEKWKRVLKNGGTLLFEVGDDQADAVERLFSREGYREIDTRADTQGRWRAVEGRL